MLLRIDMIIHQRWCTFSRCSQGMALRHYMAPSLFSDLSFQTNKTC